MTQEKIQVKKQNTPKVEKEPKDKKEESVDETIVEHVSNLNEIDFDREKI